jgi:hypothetical protein
VADNRRIQKVLGPRGAQSFDALIGKSIVSEYTETITANSGKTFAQAWNNVIYISEKGRIFYRNTLNSENTGSHEAIEDQDGSGEGKVAKFAWSDRRSFASGLIGKACVCARRSTSPATAAT